SNTSLIPLNVLFSVSLFFANRHGCTDRRRRKRREEKVYKNPKASRDGASETSSRSLHSRTSALTGPPSPTPVLASRTQN
ncbi:hypothetical protein TorRG33x02_316770, partial [Trema orientale]